MRTTDAGFTLLELLVALVVLGFIVAGLSQGLRFGLRASEREAGLTARRGDLDAADRVMRRLIVQMDPGTSRSPSALVGDRGAMAFRTDLGAAAAALSTTAADVRLEVRSGRLVLSWLPAPHVARLAAPPPPSDVLLLEGVERLELEYFGQVGQGLPAWWPEWRESSLPLLTRIRLVFPGGSARRWPDIVAGPIRPHPPG